MSNKSSIQDFVVFPNGAKLYLLPISEADVQGIALKVRAEFEAQDKPINPPTYTTEANELFEWDAESIEKDGSEEDKQKWLDYQLAINEFNQAQEYRTMFFVLTESPYKFVSSRGNEIDLTIDEIEGQWQPPEFWLKNQVKSGYILPTDPYQCKYDFLNSIIKGVELKREIITKAIALNLRGIVSDEGIAKYEATFRRAMAVSAKETEQKITIALEKFNAMAESGEGESGQG
jgi:hypothetical protein